MNNCDYFHAAPRHHIVEFFRNHIKRSHTICYIGSLVESVMIPGWMSSSDERVYFYTHVEMECYCLVVH